MITEPVKRNNVQLIGSGDQILILHMASVATKTYGDISSLHFKPIIPALFAIT
ncbi:hypothetical protein ABIB62_001200 [Mucilaginibacter sp. UYP25]